MHSFIFLAVIAVGLALVLRPPYIPRLPDHGVFVVTGAGSGIGAHVAARLVEEFPNHTIYGIIRNPKQFSKMKAVGAYPLVADLTDELSIQAAFDELRDKYIVGFFDSAGIAVPNAPVEFIDISIMKKIYDIDIFGLIAVLQEIIPSMRKNAGSRVVLLGSVTGAVTASFMGMDPAKPIEVIADALRREVKEYSIGLSVIQAGFVASPIIEKTKDLEKEIRKKHSNSSNVSEDAIYPMLAQKAYTDQVDMESMAPMSVIGDAVIEAFTVPRPKIRYVVGSIPVPMPTNLLVGLLHVLPHHVIDLFE